MTRRIRRRSFLTLLGASAAASGWPRAARAQRPIAPIVGLLDSRDQPNPSYMLSLKKGLSEVGYVEGRNLNFEFHGSGQYERLPALAVELVQRQVDVIFAASTSNAAAAALAATKTIPIVFAHGADPVNLGHVASLNRPGGNATGVSYFSAALGPKRLELLREIIPDAALIGVLFNPTLLSAEETLTEMEAAARSVGQQIAIFNASTRAEIDAAFAAAEQQRVAPLLVGADAFFNRERAYLATLAVRYRMPASYSSREFVEDGGLMSYTDDRSESFRQSGLHIGRILKGEQPANLPIVRPTRFQFVLNLRAAKALGLNIPLKLHAFADVVIE
jgi:putative ABC transport system substrate-binding protein